MPSPTPAEIAAALETLTRDALEALPDGGVYFIAPVDAAEAQARRLLAKLRRRKDAVRLVRVRTGLAAEIKDMAGAPWAVDHAAADHAEAGALDELEVAKAYLGGSAPLSG